MKQTFGMKSLVAVGVGASAAMWLTSKPNRVKAETILREWKRKLIPTVYEKSEQLPIEKGAHPHPHDVEDNNMVSEGAMYSVQFYNEKMQ
ncbi:hypothetical protein QE429_000422 [Bacillus sp. SORGH_AS 510]|uniref:hypothetical protein n=1 Tax=Bacillus sp. SORGH_AS_0510 TaxID=3041771 RepID=UPI0027868E6A|nr:hypothetical protein [Bacillus sp. SORGH_AS_0510]MDQ1143595.1 hypothetical protein [Bacillus sp. SORGH_AS_0510]